MRSQRRSTISDRQLPCSWQNETICNECDISGKIMCRFDRKDMLIFFMIMFPFFVTTIAGTIIAGYGWYLLLWLAYAIFFFFVWEARVLCSHCPNWAEPGKTLHCHANYGVIKIWKYRPGPMSKSDKIQFVIGAAIAIGFPFVLMITGHEYMFTLIGLSTVASGLFFLRKTACSRCINFSCPSNAVPKQYIDAYLKRNPQIQKAWEEAGYRIDI
jgi:hypothetical protein